MSIANNPILLVCRYPGDLLNIGKISKHNLNEYIVATDNLEVRNLASLDKRVKKVINEEKMESFYSVASNVIKARSTINKWLRELDKEVSTHLLEWINHCEGGNTTQKIQDVLLLINSYSELLVENKVQRVVLFRSFENLWEDEILIAVANSLGIPVEKTISPFGRVLIYLRLQTVYVAILGKDFKIYLPHFIFMALRTWRLLFSALFSAGKSGKINEDSNKSVQIVFLLGNSLNKHVKHITSIMKAFEKNNEAVESIALCWKTNNGRKKVIDAGLKAVNLEQWLTWSDVGNALKLRKKITKEVKKRKKDIFVESVLKFKDVNVGNLMWNYIMEFLQYTFLERLLLSRASTNYIGVNEFDAMKNWGSGILDLGKIFTKALEKNCLVNGKKKPVVFDNYFGYSFEYPYHDDCELLMDYLFVPGEIDKCYEEKTAAAKNVLISGCSSKQDVKEFKVKYTRRMSQKALGIDVSGYKMVVFYVSMGIIRGYQTKQENLLMAWALKEFAKKRPEIAILVKPRPDEPEHFWEEALDLKNKPKNIYLVRKHANPHHCINISDVVVGKFSFLLFEAMMFNKPVISVVLDGESKWHDIYGGAVEEFNDTESFINFTNRILDNKINYNEWANNINEKAKKVVFSKRFKECDEYFDKIIADTVLNDL